MLSNNEMAVNTAIINEKALGFVAINNDNCDNNNDVFYINFDRNDAVSPRSNEDDQLNINIYRYKFTQEFMDALLQFSKIHQYDDRKVFKDAWNIWVEENSDLVQNEVQRLTGLNYEGDILDKMFKSARYYFRKKSSTKPEPKDRRQYLSVQKELLDAMDQHITENIKQDDYKPSEGFVDFCEKYVELLKDEVMQLVTNYGVTDFMLIQEKIKKTYKNRYFMVVSK